MVVSIALNGGNADNRLLRFIAFGAVMPVVLIRYMLGFADSMLRYQNKD